MNEGFTDPFSLTRLPKYHPTRVAFTIYARTQELLARRYFDHFSLPIVNDQIFVDGAAIVAYDIADTAVTPPQMAMLDLCIDRTHYMRRTRVEIDAFQGATKSLASR